MLGLHTARWLNAALVLCLLMPRSAIQGQSPAAIKPSATESLTYNVEWRLITAGIARLEHNGSHLNLHLESAGLVSKLYKIEDVYDVDYDAGHCATSLHMNAQEGRRKRDTRVTFDRAHKRADYLERDLLTNTVFKQGQIEVPSCVYDIAGALRVLRFMRIDIGHSAEVPVTDGKKFAMVRVEAQEREDVKIKGKVVKTVRYEAFVFNNVIYARKGRLLLWITDDARKVPVQIQARMNFPIGNVTLSLDKEEIK